MISACFLRVSETTAINPCATVYANIVGHVVRMGEMTFTYSVLVGNPVLKQPF